MSIPNPDREGGAIGDHAAFKKRFLTGAARLGLIRHISRDREPERNPLIVLR